MGGEEEKFARPHIIDERLARRAAPSCIRSMDKIDMYGQ